VLRQSYDLTLNLLITNVRLMEALMGAVERSDVASIQGLIQQNPRLFKNHKGRGPHDELLMRAVQLDLPHVVRCLAEEGVEPNDRREDGSHVLQRACALGKLASVEALLEVGADAASPTGPGDVPLALAAVEGHVEVVRALLTHGCGDIDARHGWLGRTALCTTCIHGRVATLRLLLEAGAEWTTVARWDGRTPLARAIKYEHEECVEVLEVRDW
jgi:ankyrin repeat protein